MPNVSNKLLKAEEVKLGPEHITLLTSSPSLINLDDIIFNSEARDHSHRELIH